MTVHPRPCLVPNQRLHHLRHRQTGRQWLWQHQCIQRRNLQRPYLCDRRWHAGQTSMALSNAALPSEHNSWTPLCVSRQPTGYGLRGGHRRQINFSANTGVLLRVCENTKKAWNRPVVHSTSRGSCIACCCRTDNVRAHADMKIITVKRPI